MHPEEAKANLSEANLLASSQSQMGIWHSYGHREWLQVRYVWFDYAEKVILVTYSKSFSDAFNIIFGKKSKAKLAKIKAMLLWRSMASKND